MSAKGFPWTSAREAAALAVAEDRETDATIAAAAGISRVQLHRWKAHPAFKARVAEHLRAVREAGLAQGLRDRATRIEDLNRVYGDMLALMAHRAALPGHVEAGGERGAGLLARSVKMIGSGPNAYEVDEFTFDAALVRELRATSEQAAKELGQWAEKRQVDASVHIEERRVTEVVLNDPDAVRLVHELLAKVGSEA